MTPEVGNLSLATKRRRSRRSTTARGYGSAHQANRARAALIVAGGMCPCSRCGELILPGQPWDLDHRDDRRGYLGAAHRSCNRSASRPGIRRRKKSRQW